MPLPVPHPFRPCQFKCLHTPTGRTAYGGVTQPMGSSVYMLLKCPRRRPPDCLPANWAGSSVGRKKTINCVAQVEKQKKNKKGRKIKERQKTKNSRNILKRRARNCKLRAGEEQRSVLEINTQLKPFANGHAPTPTARTWHICCRPIDAACTVALWHGGTVSWAELSCGWAGFMAGGAQK